MPSVDEQTSEIKPKYVMVCVNRRLGADRASCEAQGSINLAMRLSGELPLVKLMLNLNAAFVWHNAKKAKRYGLHRAGGLY